MATQVLSLINKKKRHYSRLLVACGDSPLHMWVVGCAAAGGAAHNPHKNPCELPKAVRSQEETRVITKNHSLFIEQLNNSVPKR